MNARLYDPALGRFIAMDPFVQTPDFSQNFNRYSYALNNPLKYTDPSGELFVIDDLIAAIAIGAIINTWINIATNNINSGGDFVMSVGIGGLSGAAGGAAAYGINGAISVAGAIPNALATGAAQAGLGAAIGFGQNGLNNVVAGNSFIDGWQQAVIGGAIGGFVSGAVSGGIKGYNIAKYAGKNVWWGNQVKYGRTQYSFFTSEKPYATVKFPIKFTPDGNNTCVVQSLAEFEKAMGGSRTMEDFISSTGYSEKGVCLGTVGADGCEYTYQNISDFLSGQGFKNNSSLTLAQMQNSVLMQSESLSGSNVGIAYTDPKLGGHVTSVKTIKYFQDFVKIYGRGQTYILNKLEQWNPFYFLISK
jgi:hypothetical protein